MLTSLANIILPKPEDLQELTAENWLIFARTANRLFHGQGLEEYVYGLSRGNGLSNASGWEYGGYVTVGSGGFKKRGDGFCFQRETLSYDSRLTVPFSDQPRFAFIWDKAHKRRVGIYVGAGNYLLHLWVVPTRLKNKV